MNQATAFKSSEDMQKQADSSNPANQQDGAVVTSSKPGVVEFKVLRRNGSVADFSPGKIATAMTKAFLAVEGEGGSASSKIKDQVRKLTEQIVGTLQGRLPEGGVFHIEHIQDQVEISLMRAGEYEAARRYVLYRDEQAKKRSSDEVSQKPKTEVQISYTRADGERALLNVSEIEKIVDEARTGFGEEVSTKTILDGALGGLYDGVSEAELWRAIVFSSRALIEKEPHYSFVTARLLLHTIRKEVLGEEATQTEMNEKYATYFKTYIEKGISCGLLDEKLREFDLDVIGKALDGKRDLKFEYLGLQTIYDRYLLHDDDVRFELPQAFWMRVAMGLSMQEVDRENRAIEFYNLLSNFDFVSSTPTLFNSGTRRPQLSSCFLTTVADDLSSIYDGLRENALLSKFSGGLGNDWTPVRALGAHIKGTNGKSQGVVPFLKVVNDTAVAVNQGGKRKGAVCCYLEVWHSDIEEFLELRKNTGDDRRRTHDMNTASWIPDLFMQRVMNDEPWTLFSPDEVPDLHDLYGTAFKEAYEKYEAKAERGELKLSKQVPAVTIWRKLLSMLFETGHPWITFKDPCNLRSPQQHKGVVHSSNLCTEITLNTSDTETAVCNLGSVNLVAHLKDGKLNLAKLSNTCRTAMRMLDNVIDINFYSVPKARNSNLKHRPVGMGMMGFQDALLTLRIPYASQEAIEFADNVYEAISYYAIGASSELAEERGKYPTYEGSLWSKGIFPIDSLSLLEESRKAISNGETVYFDVDRSSQFDWKPIREHVAKHGMRNSNCLAIAPTATIANIAGVSPSIEPTFQNLYVKSNLSGEFTVINTYLVEELKKLDLWDEVMIHDLKYFDGSVMPIERIPEEVKSIYATAFEIDPNWLVESGSRRQKWIDQAQSLNLYVSEPNGKKLDDLYKAAWIKGLKTTYYLRTTSATYTEKSTFHRGALNAVANQTKPEVVPIVSGESCDPMDTECEACQ